MASSCCGGGSSSSMIITGDNQQEWSAGFSYRDDLGQTDDSGWATFNGDKVKDQQSSFNLQYQRQIGDQFQLATKTSLIQKSMQKQGRDEQNRGLGDIDLQAHILPSNLEDFFTQNSPYLVQKVCIILILPFLVMSEEMVYMQ